MIKIKWKFCNTAVGIKTCVLHFDAVYMTSDPLDPFEFFNIEKKSIKSANNKSYKFGLSKLYVIANLPVAKETIKSNHFESSSRMS